MPHQAACPFVPLLFLASGLLLSDRVQDCKESWADPWPLLDQQGRPLYVARPQIVATRYGVALLGNDAVVWALNGSSAEIFEGSPRTDPLAGFLLSAPSHARPIAAPPRMQRFLDPVATADSSGVAHVIWGTSSNPGRDRRQWRVDQLWYARFDGSKWTAAEPLPLTPDRGTGGALEWNAVSPAIVLAPDGELYVAEPRASDVFLYRRDVHGRWAITQYPRGASYVTLRALGHGHLVLAYTGGIRPATSRPRMWDRGLLVTTSRDAGLTWSAPIVVQSAGRGEAYSPALVPVSDSGFGVVWVQRDSGRQFPDSVLLATSSNLESWSRDPGLSVAGGVLDFAATTDQHAGAYAAVLTGDGQRNNELVAARWTSRWDLIGRFSDVTLPFQLASIRDSLIVTWTRTKPAGAAGIPTLMVTSYHSCSTH